MSRLLDDMCELMSNQSPPLGCPWRKLTCTKHNAMTQRVSMRVDIPRRLSGSCTGMHTHIGKVIAEALLHVLTEQRLQRPARAGQSLAYTGGWCIRLSMR